MPVLLQLSDCWYIFPMSYAQRVARQAVRHAVAVRAHAVLYGCSDARALRPVGGEEAVAVGVLGVRHRSAEITVQQ